MPGGRARDARQRGRGRRELACGRCGRADCTCTWEGLLDRSPLLTTLCVLAIAAAPWALRRPGTIYIDTLCAANSLWNAQSMWHLRREAAAAEAGKRVDLASFRPGPPRRELPQWEDDRRWEATSPSTWQAAADRRARRHRVYLKHVFLQLAREELLSYEKRMGWPTRLPAEYSKPSNVKKDPWPYWLWNMQSRWFELQGNKLRSHPVLFPFLMTEPKDWGVQMFTFEGCSDVCHEGSSCTCKSNEKTYTYDYEEVVYDDDDRRDHRDCLNGKVPSRSHFDFGSKNFTDVWRVRSRAARSSCSMRVDMTVPGGPSKLQELENAIDWWALAVLGYDFRTFNRWADQKHDVVQAFQDASQTVRCAWEGDDNGSSSSGIGCSGGAGGGGCSCSSGGKGGDDKAADPWNCVAVESSKGAYCSQMGAAFEPSALMVMAHVREGGGLQAWRPMKVAFASGHEDDDDGYNDEYGVPSMLLHWEWWCKTTSAGSKPASDRCNPIYWPELPSVVGFAAGMETRMEEHIEDYWRAIIEDKPHLEPPQTSLNQFTGQSFFTRQCGMYCHMLMYTPPDLDWSRDALSSLLRAVPLSIFCPERELAEQQRLEGVLYDLQRQQQREQQQAWKGEKKKQKRKGGNNGYDLQLRLEQVLMTLGWEPRPGAGCADMRADGAIDLEDWEPFILQSSPILLVVVMPLAVVFRPLARMLYPWTHGVPEEVIAKVALSMYDFLMFFLFTNGISLLLRSPSQVWNDVMITTMSAPKAAARASSALSNVLLRRLPRTTRALVECFFVRLPRAACGTVAFVLRAACGVAAFVLRAACGGRKVQRACSRLIGACRGMIGHCVASFRLLGAVLGDVCGTCVFAAHSLVWLIIRMPVAAWHGLGRGATAALEACRSVWRPAPPLPPTAWPSEAQRQPRQQQQRQHRRGTSKGRRSTPQAPQPVQAWMVAFEPLLPKAQQGPNKREERVEDKAGQAAAFEAAANSPHSSSGQVPPSPTRETAPDLPQRSSSSSSSSGSGQVPASPTCETSPERQQQQHATASPSCAGLASPLPVPQPLSPRTAAAANDTAAPLLPLGIAHGGAPGDVDEDESMLLDLLLSQSSKGNGTALPAPQHIPPLPSQQQGRQGLGQHLSSGSSGGGARSSSSSRGSLPAPQPIHNEASDLKLGLGQGRRGNAAPDASKAAAAAAAGQAQQHVGEVRENFDSSGAGSSSGGRGTGNGGGGAVAAAAASLVNDAAGLGEQCIMCFDAPKATTLAPCGHRALCAACTKKLLGMRGDGPDDCPMCPVCRTAVESYITRVFTV